MTDAYIGAETGALKGIDFSKNAFQNYNAIGELDRAQEISRMCRIRTGDLPDQTDCTPEESILCALINRQLKIFNPSTNTYTTLFTCEGGTGPIKGVEELDSKKIVTCVESGEMNVWNLNGFTKEASMNAGDNISRMRRSPLNTNILATGGRENPLKLWDLHNAKQPVFTAKNVKNDWLDLRVPIWETDFRFSPSNECIYTCTGHHHIRMYDPRGGQRRPVVQIQWGECPFTSMSLAPRENQVVAGNSQGYMGLFDIRGKGDSKLVHSYKGFAGSISSIECHPTEPYVASCGIDRFARLHQLFTKEQLNKIYCKARLNCLLLNDDLSISKSRDGLEENAGEDEDVYHSDEDQTEDDDVWEEMRKVQDGRKKKRSDRDSASASEDDRSVQSPLEETERRKPSKKKKRKPLVAALPTKRTSSPPVSQKPRKKSRPENVDDAKLEKRQKKRKALDDSLMRVKVIKRSC